MSAVGTAGILRKGLIVFQFVVAQVFIISAIIVGNQLLYMQNNDLGFNYDAVLTISIPSSVQRDKTLLHNKFVFKEALAKHPEIASVALGDLPMDIGAVPIIANYQSDSGMVQTHVNLKYADEDYMDLYQLKLLAGKPLTASDTGLEYMINEAELKVMGLASP
ncbi:hypothetical protein SAMN05216436_11729 [bacterium A37T11]|nr:hypothetical protein SAMN05216436_11729 [bacterium A37T11]